MAQIPLGNAGNAVPNGTISMPSSGRAEAAAELGRAIQNIGRAGAQIAIDMKARQDRELEIEREKSDAAQALDAFAQGKAGLRERRGVLAESIQTGGIAPDSAAGEWKQRSSEFVEEAVKAAPQSRQRLLKAHLLAHAAEMEGDVRDAVRTKRREDTRAGLMSALEDAEREAVGNREAVTMRVVRLAGELGPYAGLGADDQQRLVQGFRERAAFNDADAAVRNARDDPASLDAVIARITSAEFADLSPDRKAVLEQRVIARKGYLQQQEQTRIVRAEAAAARRDREAQQALTGLQTVIDNGGFPDQAMLASVQAKTGGTAIAPAVTQLLNDAADMSSFAQQTPQQQQATLLQMRAQANAQGTNPRQEARMSRLEGIAAASSKSLAADPLVYGADRRLIGPVGPIAFSDVGSLVNQLGERVQQAQTVSARVGRPVSPLLSGEAQQLGEMLNVLPYAQREKALQVVAKSLPDPGMTRALAQQIAPKDPTLGLAMFAAGKRGPGGESPSLLILRAQDAVNAGRVKETDEQAVRTRVEIAKELSKVEWATPLARDATADAAHRIWLGLRDQGSGATTTKAVALATGGLVAWADKKVPLPYGMAESEFRSAMGRMDGLRLGGMAMGEPFSVGGHRINANDLADMLPTVTLVPVDDGVYALQVGGAMVQVNGRAFRLNVRR